MAKKIVILIAGVLFLGTGLITLSFAQGMDGTMGKEMMENGMPAYKENMGMCPMRGMMMKGMMEKSIVSAADGGIIVLAGNKLIKYDKDLNMQNEIEIKIDMDAVKKQMMEMMECCPMMKDGKMNTGMAENSPVSKIMPAGGTDKKAQRKY